MVASCELILSGPICVDCKYNLALDSAGADLPEKRVDCFSDVEGCRDCPDLLFNRLSRKTRILPAPGHVLCPAHQSLVLG